MILNRISVLIAPVAILILFGSALVGKDRLAFRDVGHFYTPLYDYVAHRTDQQWLPLWNPLDATGMPLLGETTTAILYPPRYLIFSLPVSTDVAMAIYVVAHLILASITATRAAKWAGASDASSRMAGVLYPLSGSVLFLYCNPPFLVGAAWLPLVVGSLTADRFNRSTVRCLIGGPAIAMMVLGGDPQAALHSVLVVVGFWIVRRLKGNTSVVPLYSIIVSCLFAASLAAPQLAASVAWSSQSDRVVAETEDDWTEPPLPGSRRYEAYQFSLPPWHIAELLTPNAFGSLLPIYRRSSSLLPGEGRMWTPTIYLGAITTIGFICIVLFRRGGERKVNAWMWLAVISLLLSFGHFGFVWLMQQIPGVLPRTDSAIGGPYWILSSFMPRYDAFRYPTKWLPFFSLGASVAIALWIEEFQWRESFRRIGFIVSAIVVLIAIAAGVFIGQLTNIDLSRHSADIFWGPLDGNGAAVEIARSLLHSVVVLFAITSVMFFGGRRSWNRTRSINTLVLLTATELCFVGVPLVAKVDRNVEQQALGIARLDGQAHRWMRTQGDGSWPRQWRETSNVHRLSEVEVSGRLAWFGRWHLADREPVFNNMVSIRSRRVSAFWKAAHRVTKSMSSSERDLFWQHIRQWLRIDGILHVSGNSTPLKIDQISYCIADVSIRKEADYESGFSFAHNWQVTNDQTSVEVFEHFMKQVHFACGRPQAQLNAEGPIGIEPPPDANPSVTIDRLAQSPDQVMIRVSNESDGILLRSTLQDGGWVAEARRKGEESWQKLRVHSVDFLTQGVPLPSGDWEVRFRYAPWWLWWAMTVSGVSWLAYAILATLSIRQTASAGIK